MKRKYMSLMLVAILVGVGSSVASNTRSQNSEPMQAASGGLKGLARSAWPCFRGNAQGTARAVGNTRETPPSWKLQTLPVAPGVIGIYASPAIAEDGTVYIGSDKLYALDGDTGKVKWSFYIANSMFNSCPAIGPDGLIYAGCDSDVVTQLDPHTGKVRHTIQVGGQLVSSPALGRNGLLYIGAHNGRMYAFRASDGKLVWTHNTHAWLDTSPVPDEEGSVYCTGEGSVYALNGTTGQLRWKYVGTTQESAGSPVVGADGTVYVGLVAEGPGRYKRGEIVALDPRTGEAKWKFPTGAYIYSTPAIGSDGTVYIGCGDHCCYALNGKTGKLKWKFVTGDRIQGSPAIGGDGTVYIGSYDKKLYALDGATGAKKWEYETGGALQGSPAIGANGLIYVGGLDGVFYAIRPPDGKTKGKEAGSSE